MLELDIININYSKKSDRLKINTGKSYESRAANTVFLFIKALDCVRNEIKKSFKVEIHCTDYVEEFERRIWAFSNNGRENVELIPDPFFINWPECGIDNYNNTCHEIELLGQKPPIYEECFWIGNVETHPSRKMMLEKFENNKHFKLIAMNWIRKKDRGEKHDADKYVSLPDHAKYKYLLDIRGNGYSGRLKFLLFSNRPLFYVEREDVEFFNKDLKPFVHYIPVKKDLSDLEEKYEWAQSHEQEARQIAKNALLYAKENLTTEAAIKYYANLILKNANKKR